MESTARCDITRIVLTTIYLWLGWVLFSWSIAPRTLLFGLIHSIVIALLTYRIFVEHDEAERRSHIPRIPVLLLYLLHLIFQMYISGFRVLRQILRGRTRGWSISEPASGATSPGWRSPIR